MHCPICNLFHSQPAKFCGRCGANLLLLKKAKELLLTGKTGHILTDYVGIYKNDFGILNVELLEDKIQVSFQQEKALLEHCHFGVFVEQEEKAVFFQFSDNLEGVIDRVTIFFEKENATEFLKMT